MFSIRKSIYLGSNSKNLHLAKFSSQPSVVMVVTHFRYATKGGVWWPSKAHKVLFGNGWPFPNNTEGKQERLLHLPPNRGEPENVLNQIISSRPNMCLLQFFLTQFRPFYLVINSGNFGRFIGQ